MLVHIVTTNYMYEGGFDIIAAKTDYPEALKIAQSEMAKPQYSTIPEWSSATSPKPWEESQVDPNLDDPPNVAVISWTNHDVVVSVKTLEVS